MSTLDLNGFQPMIASEGTPPALDDPAWIWELKYDGIRILARFGKGQVELRTRHSVDATTWFPELTRALARVQGGPFVTDGEVCVLDDMGRSDFNAVIARTRKKRWLPGMPTVTYCVFDLLATPARSLMQLPLLERRKRLFKCLSPAPERVLLVSHFEAPAADLWQGVLQLKLEGLVAKRPDSVYVPGVVSRDWVKKKRKGHAEGWHRL